MKCLQRFDEFMETALYGPGGFYTAGRGAGRRGRDFLTSPEVGPLFGLLIASKLDSIWDELGRPQDFTVVDAGAGAGTLARSVMAARPRCAPVLRYVLVERSEVLRRAHDSLADLAAKRGVTEVVSLPDLPERPLCGAIIANELLDNLPARLFERTFEGWSEVYVEEVAAVAEGPHASGWNKTSAPPPAAEAAFPLAACRREALRPLPSADAEFADCLAPDAPQGSRIPLAAEAVGWVGRALDLLHAGRLIVVDYADVTSSLAARPQGEWLRTYRSQARGAPPLADTGLQDITVEVPLDQILCAHPGAQVSDQASYLRGLGLERMVAEGRDNWGKRAGIGDLAAVVARSRVVEAEALCDPSGLGAFAVLEWHVR